jgi:tetratricopeptide (TPR) repeat protein
MPAWRSSFRRLSAVFAFLLSLVWVGERAGVAARQATPQPARPQPAFAPSAPSTPSPSPQAQPQLPAPQPPAPQPQQAQPQQPPPQQAPPPPQTQPAPRQPPAQTPPAADAPAEPQQDAPAPAEPADAHVRDAARALREGRYDKVDDLTERASAGGPSAAALATLHAKALIARGRYDDAVAALTAAAAAAPGSDAPLELGLLQQYLGHRPEATATLNGLLRTLAAQQNRSGADLLRAGRAARALGLYRQANALFQEASRLQPQDPALQTAWGDLFLEKYNTPESVEAFRAALKIDPRWTDAHVGLSRALLDDDQTAALEEAKQALAINKASVPARLIFAQVALDERRLDDARTEIGRALDVNASSLEALSLQAALANLEGRTPDFDAAVAKALAINPKYGEIYRVAGAQTADHYRFAEAVALVKKAIALDPENSRAQGDLGMHLLRTGDEPGARVALEQAFKRDAYDVSTYNLLALLDALDKFETIKDGNLIVRLHPDDAPVMREAVIKLAHTALGDLSKRYGGFTPRGPVLIEAFPRHDDFAVRTLGLPGMIGALGACFGNVVTLDAPRARQPGAFNWEATLWHELAHVITLQMSNQRVPRWLTEGISVFEERRARPEWGREGEYTFIGAYAHNGLIKVADLNSGFSSSRTIIIAYHEASLVVEHLVELYGDAGLQKMLRAYGEGLGTDEVLKRALNTDMDALEHSFDQFLERRFGKAKDALKTLKSAPPVNDTDVAELKAFADEHHESYAAQVQVGRVAFVKGDLETAQAALERAVTLIPQTMGDQSARAALADVFEKRGDKVRAMRELETVIAESHTALDSARQLATLAREANDEARERFAVARIVTLDPTDAGAHGTLGRLALAKQDAPVALRELQLALTLGAADRAAVHTDMAEAYWQQGDSAQTRQHAIAALEIAPRFERAQELLLKVVDSKPPQQ